MFKTIDLFALAAYRLAQAAILGTLGVVSFEVISRYIFNNPTQSSLEITEYLLVAMGFLPLAAIHRSRGHVSVEILTSLLSPKGQRVCQFLALGITFLFAAIVAWFGFDLTIHAYTSNTLSSSLLSFPMWIAYVTIPLGFTALALESLRQLTELFSADASEVNTQDGAA